MKKSILALGLLIASLSVNATENYKLDAKSSKIEWVGKKLAGQHEGTINFSEGEFNVAKGQLVAGRVTVDMNSIVTTDLQGEYKGKLEGHLKAPDFFDVAQFATSKFEITSVVYEGKEKAKIQGKLTIKGISQEVSLDATVKLAGSAMVAVGKIKVDRTKYGLKYGSKSFFSDLGDKVIDDEFELSLNVIAKK